MKKLFTIIACLLLALTVQAQTDGKVMLQYIHMSDTTLVFPVSKIDSVTFALGEPPIGDELTAVDLGLSVKWANRNVGAKSPTDYGNYYAWGETVTKDEYTVLNYAWFDDYNNNGEYDFGAGELVPIGSDISGTIYDPAHTTDGGYWHMPSQEEMDELINNCTWTWTSRNGVTGYEITGPSGRSIFMPAGGSIYGQQNANKGNQGRYWTGTFASTGEYSANALSFMDGSKYCSTSTRFEGCNVRAVYSEDFRYFDLTDVNVSNITSNAATISGAVTNYDGTAEIGVLLSTTEKYLLQEARAFTGSATDGTFTVETIGLQPATTYYYKAYVKDGEKYFFSEQSSFTTEDGANAQPEAVDLGLPSGTKWASMNVGASAPEVFGGYYAWGETEEKDDYDWDTYAYFYDADGDGNYNYDVDSVVNIGMDISGTDYDVAHVKLGGDWHMPTDVQAQELIDNCTITATTLNGVSGMEFKGPNGNTIFIPMGGMKEETLSQYVGENGFFWTSTLFVSDDLGEDFSRYFYISSDYKIGRAHV